MADEQAIVDAINDLTRVTVALHGGFATKSEAVRRLAELSIPPTRIAAILAMPANDVRSVLAKARRGTRQAPGPDSANQSTNSSEVPNPQRGA